MILFTKAIERDLAINGAVRKVYARNGEDMPAQPPVVKLFAPSNACTWLITEMDCDDPDILFGLCDIGQGTPELGSVRRSELENARGPFGLKIERDRHFNPGDKTLDQYAEEAWASGRISA